jgi:hypothetical protein
LSAVPSAAGAVSGTLDFSLAIPESKKPQPHWSTLQHPKLLKPNSPLNYNLERQSGKGKKKKAKTIPWTEGGLDSLFPSAKALISAPCLLPRQPENTATLPDLLDIQCVTQNTHSAQPGGCHVLRVSSSPEKEMPNKKWLGCIMRIYLEDSVFVSGNPCRDWMWCALPSERRAVSVAVAIAIAPSGNAQNPRNAQKSSSVIRQTTLRCSIHTWTTLNYVSIHTWTILSCSFHTWTTLVCDYSIPTYRQKTMLFVNFITHCLPYMKQKS